MILLAVALGGCSSSLDSGASGGGSTFRERMSQWFSSSSDGEAQALVQNAADPNQDCPLADIRSGASTMLFPPGETERTAVRYQASISRLARECAVRGTAMTVKVGVQGRVILGPAGGPGQIDLPLRYAVVREGPEPRTVMTKLYRLPVAIAEAQGNVPFLHIEEDLTFTVPRRADLENYVVYVGFDPGAAAPKTPPAKKGRRPG